jgi:hypothetical protein
MAADVTVNGEAAPGLPAAGTPGAMTLGAFVRQFSHPTAEDVAAYLRKALGVGAYGLPYRGFIFFARLGREEGRLDGETAEW